MFIRRLFYDRNTLDILYHYMMQGDILVEPAEYVAARENLADWALFEWTQPDADMEAQFAAHNTVEVALRNGVPALIFSDTEPEQYADEQADMLTALNILGVTPEEG